MNLGNFFKNLSLKMSLRKVVKSLPDAVLIVSTEGKILWLNEKTEIIFEGSKKLLKTHNFNDLVDNGNEKIEKAMSVRTPVIAGAFTPAAKEFFIELNAKRYGKNSIVTIRDITAMTNVLTNAEQTSQFNKEKNAMLVKLANEIKSPLNSISGFSQALIDGISADDKEKQNKYLKIINKNSNELLYFMEKFIDFSYSESTLYEYNFQTFDVINTIQTIIRDNNPDSSSKGLVTNFDYEGLLKRTAYSDEKSLKMILQNLYETSIRLTDTGSITFKIFSPDIEVTSAIRAFENTKNESLIQISITDTGIGVQENEMNGIFEPYTLLDKTSRKNIVRSLCLGTASIIAKRLGGFVWAESEVMKGTTFNVIIPIEKDFLLKYE